MARAHVRAQGQTSVRGGVASSPSGIAPQRQVNVVEPLTAAGAILAAPEALNNVLEAAERIYKYFNKEDPFLCQVLDSHAEGDQYVVSLNLSNHTLHGVYLERVDLFKPDVTTLTLEPPQTATKKSGGGGLSFASSSQPAAPVAPPKPIPPYRRTLIGPGQSLGFNVRFSMPPDAKPVESGRLTLTLSRLNESKSRPRDLIFRILLPD